jgi:hypothetical protein
VALAKFALARIPRMQLYQRPIPHSHGLLLQNLIITH